MKYTMYLSLSLIISVSSVVAMETDGGTLCKKCKKEQQAYKALLIHNMHQLHELMETHMKLMSRHNEVTRLIASQNERLKSQAEYLKGLADELLPAKQSRLKSRSKHD